MLRQRSVLIALVNQTTQILFRKNDAQLLGKPLAKFHFVGNLLSVTFALYISCMILSVYGALLGLEAA